RADGAIPVGAIDDADTINRTDDFVASYSNYGPREGDNDNDDWDELKPDVTSYGSGMFSASAATGASLPGTPRPMAEDGYESKDGTSMATPLVSGVVALMLQADSSLTPEEIKDILRNSSEKRGNPTEPDVSNRWNDKWGFGLVDASCAVDTVLDRNCSPLTGGGGVIVPPDNDTSLGVEITSPNNGSWFVTDELLRIEGNLIENTGPWNDVNIRILQYLEDFEEVVLMDWTTAGGDDDYWYLDVLIKDEWYDSEELNVVIEVKAVGSDDLVSSDIRYGNIGKMVANF
ncbi:MAG: S8 family serine peptidase, partial [Euryarchaeota archaeon]